MKIDPVEGYRAQITLARFDKQEGRIEELLRKAVEARPASYDAQMALGDWCASQRKFDEAERHAREAIRMHPDRAAPYGLLAVVLVHQDKWTELDAALAQAEKADPDNLLPYFRAANNCLARKVELPRAERYFRKYLTAGAGAATAESGQRPLAPGAGAGAAGPQAGSHRRIAGGGQAGRQLAGQGGIEAPEVTPRNS